MTKDIPHIAIEFPDYFPEDFEEMLTSGIENDLLDLRVLRKEPIVWAASEWIVPGLIAVYILKPYFESFLKEAGREHYTLLKSKINDILSKSKKMEVNKITTGGTTQKLNSSNTQSKAISVSIQTKQGIIIKLLYDNNLDIETWQELTNDFLKLVESHYEQNENPLTNYLKKLDKERDRTIYAIIDPESRKWTLINNLGQYERDNSKKN